MFFNALPPMRRTRALIGLEPLRYCNMRCGSDRRFGSGADVCSATVGRPFSIQRTNNQEMALGQKTTLEPNVRATLLLVFTSCVTANACKKPCEERPMRFYSRKSAVPRPMIECAQCGDQLFLPEWSEHLDGSSVRHLWQCEACGYSFETTVVYSAAVTVAA